ncbi:hypothetical protein GCM10007216_35670 [Thalassobacillus devorans]|uniref:SLH domain-containing protein n=1 Tax=Thalassobacillus devorans TaxID=279813 RepID=A0ABQ1PRF7_9BACI|nr:S8 family serine peptidase [Thalassobacillus devorans]NIK30577.1 serine protease AprX [Thalassobacillus devorans]GGD01794.1 hypothetical protein GCM10007216_35670 [Thalassobacillus devorans]
MRVKLLSTTMVLALGLLIGILSNTSSGSAAISGPIIDDILLEELANQEGTVEAIITFEGENALTDAQLNLLEDAGITKGIIFESLPMTGALVTKDQIEQLKSESEIRSIYFNQKVEYENGDATALTGVDRVRTSDSFRENNGGLPVSGSGVGVVINDSGVDGTHKDHEYPNHLVQNVDASLNLHAVSEFLPITYLEDVPNTDTDSGHGTHVAGIVGGNGEMSGGKYEGVAPGADLIGYGSGAAVTILDTIGGFDYALTHQQEYDIRVITNSWGSTSDAGTEFDPHDPINVATKRLYDRGIVTVFSAGNSGPGEATISGNYKKAPWVITVAAGTKDGKLTDFSSRGVKEKSSEVVVDGETWTWEDRPTITAPGEGIISTRVVSPLSSLGAADDVENIDPSHLPYYTTMSGTSMAAPHIAGIIALLLEADPTLSPLEVKQVIQDTATNMPGYEPWEVGAGYVNAYAVVDAAFSDKSYGSTVNMNRTFHAEVNTTVDYDPFTIEYDPLNLSDNSYVFEVEERADEVTARINAKGLLEETGNTVNLLLEAPDGTTYSSGVSVLFPLYTDRTVQVTDPIPGTWKVRLEGLQGTLSLPEKIKGELAIKSAAGYSGLNDINGHSGEAAIKMAVSERLIDSFNDNTYKPDQPLERIELAKFLVMGAGVVQSLPAEGDFNFRDVKADNQPFAEAVTATGAALLDKLQVYNGVMLPGDNGKFSGKQAVSRAELAYSLVQSLGLQEEAEQREEGPLTVMYNGERIPVVDEADVPAELKGYVQLALDLNMLNAYFSVNQGDYDLEPAVEAAFKPDETVTRADYAVAITRYFQAYLK